MKRLVAKVVGSKKVAGRHGLMTSMFNAVYFNSGNFARHFLFKLLTDSYYLIC